MGAGKEFIENLTKAIEQSKLYSSRNKLYVLPPEWVNLLDDLGIYSPLLQTRMKWTCKDLIQLHPAYTKIKEEIELIPISRSVFNLREAFNVAKLDDISNWNGILGLL